MRKMKKIVTGVLAFSMLLSSTINASANTPSLYIFNDLWNGRGKATVEIDSSNSELKILSLQSDDNIMESPQFNKSSKDGNVFLTFEESTLKSLNLKNGVNNISAVISGENDKPYWYEDALISEEEKNKVYFNISKNVIRIDKITYSSPDDYSEIEVPKDKYTAVQTENQYIVTLDEEYAKALEDTYFTLYCQTNYVIFLQLVKGELGDANADGIIDLSDAKEVLKTALGIERESTQVLKLADYDKDDKITLIDAKSLLNAALGIDKTK